MRQNKDIMEFAGAWKNISNERIEKIKAHIKALRKKNTKEWSERIKRLHGN
ncbi:MAG: hypothetical protein AABX23_05110 [Nanoarchaeota archaeon]